MTRFQEKNIGFLGKSENPAAIEILLPLLDFPDKTLRDRAFDALYRKKDAVVDLRLFAHFVKNEEAWKGSPSVGGEKLSRLADAAYRSENATMRETAAKIILQYRLYETLPTVMMYLESDSEELSTPARAILMQLSESFYAELLQAPPEERRNFDRKREWFVQQMDSAVRRYSVHPYDELIKSLLILGKKEYPTLLAILMEHQSIACKKAAELLSSGEHGSYIRLLLSCLGDPDSPAMIDEIIVARSDKPYVQNLLATVGPSPAFPFQDALKRFKGFAWLTPQNPNLADLVAGKEPEAIQLLQAIELPKYQKVALYRFFLSLPVVEARRAAAVSVRRLVGEEVHAMLLEFVNDPDPETCATIFRILKARDVKELEAHFIVLAERPEPEIRKALYDTMPDLHIESFAARISQMTAMQAKRLGYFVRKIDPATPKVIEDDLASPLSVRRQMACTVAAATNCASLFEARILDIALYDDEALVRCAAILALGTILTKGAVETIRSLIDDHSTTIRDAAREALRNWMTTYQAQQSGVQ